LHFIAPVDPTGALHHMDALASKTRIVILGGGFEGVHTACLQLARPRLALLVLFKVGAGWFLAAGEGPHWLSLVHALIGTALLVAGASALNQLLERRCDTLRPRTANRPLPAGRGRVREKGRPAPLETGPAAQETQPPSYAWECKTQAYSTIM
jgi:hypothetical protein